MVRKLPKKYAFVVRYSHTYYNFLPLIRTMNSNEKREYLIKLGEHIKHLRQAQGLSYRELAARCSLDHSKIGKIEQGLHNITATTIYELAVGLNISPSRIFDFPLDSQ